MFKSTYTPLRTTRQQLEDLTEEVKEGILTCVTLPDLTSDANDQSRKERGRFCLVMKALSMQADRLGTKLKLQLDAEAVKRSGPTSEQEAQGNAKLFSQFKKASDAMKITGRHKETMFWSSLGRESPTYAFQSPSLTEMQQLVAFLYAMCSSKVNSWRQNYRQPRPEQALAGLNVLKEVESLLNAVRHIVSAYPDLAIVYRWAEEDARSRLAKYKAEVLECALDLLEELVIHEEAHLKSVVA
jgi:hypothetical protein